MKLVIWEIYKRWHKWGSIFSMTTVIFKHFGRSIFMQIASTTYWKKITKMARFRFSASIFMSKTFKSFSTFTFDIFNFFTHLFGNNGPNFCQLHTSPFQKPSEFPLNFAHTGSNFILIVVARAIPNFSKKTYSFDM